MRLIHISTLDKEDDDHEESTAVAVDGSKNSQSALKWTKDHLFNKGNHHVCIFVYVQTKTTHPQDIMNAINKESRPATQQELQNIFLPYRAFCARNGIQTKEAVLHSADVASALVHFVAKNNISNIVLGASIRNALTRRFKQPDVPSILLKSAPDLCAVYVISCNGKVQHHKASGHLRTPTSSATPAQPKFPASAAVATRISLPESASQAIVVRHQNTWGQLPSSDSPTSIDMSRSSYSTGSWRSESSNGISCQKNAYYLQMMLNDRHKSSYKSTLQLNSMDSSSTEMLNKYSESVSSSGLSWPQSIQSTNMSSENFPPSRPSLSPKSSNTLLSPRALEEEMRRLKLQLEHSMQLYNTAETQAILAKKMALEARLLQKLDTSRSEDRTTLEALTQMANHLAEVEVLKQKNAETRLIQEEKEENATLFDDNVHYKRYTIEEIEAATDDFSISNKIGEGGYGPVYKGMLDDTSVAIKILRPDYSEGHKQFRKEIEVLSSMRHPNMVVLLGACPDYGCLVYEYMDNGSLDDRLFKKGNTPPIPWRTRFRIAAEIGSGLLFLHETKPEPLVHRDLKPANILIDSNYMSKISDVGLAKLVPKSVADNISTCYLTAAAGTFCYIDPEYQQTGKLSVKSDLYSLGIMLLQLITGKPPMGLSYQVQQAIKKGTFANMLDPDLTDWPVEEALSLATLALRCCELRKRDRPDLATVVLPKLNCLRDFAAEKPNMIPSQHPNSSVLQPWNENKEIQDPES